MGRFEGDMWGFKIRELMFRVGEWLRFCSFFWGGGGEGRGLTDFLVGVFWV